MNAISLREAAKHIVTGRAKPPSGTTMRAWTRTGYRPRQWKGEPILLRSVRLGVDLCTTLEWVEEFNRARLELGEQVRRAEALASQMLRERPLRSRKASQRRAAEYLDRMGCK